MAPVYDAVATLRKNWSAKFRRRHHATLDTRYLNTLDLEKHKAESKASFQQYFDILQQKIQAYDIQPYNTYNMDEKGFLIGHLQKVQRIFPKAMMKQQKLLGTGQDGNREWITVLATVCADGTSLPSALVYKATSGDLQDIWLQDYDTIEHQCWFASSPNGWTSNELGLSWLQSLFHTQTVTKARRNWRLLTLDGHGSHCTIEFLDCQELDHHTRISQGLTRLTKRDFFSNFFRAYQRAFTEANIKSAWLKTGLEPFNPDEMLQIFKNDTEALPVTTPSGSRSSSCLDSPTAIEGCEQTKQRMPCLATELTHAREREQGYLEVIQQQKRRKKHGRPFTEELRAQEGLGVLFFSPSKIERAKELQAAKEKAKEVEAQSKMDRAQDRATQKAQKEVEAQQRREDRIARAGSRKATAALKKAERQRQQEAKQIAKRAITDSEATNSRPFKRPKTQKRPQRAMVAETQPTLQQAVEEAKTRSGRAIRKQRHRKEI
ncbi:hypothetical protein B0A48_18633 [Cryoendolithus antarcticus]|uniref:DDE-1 domain-containing protein n=1 Tax=Cryoendolithus antarcticus TaxID=1507870 RepID=A0A1V8S883_9PEZI|nr:hypothetical protein B0A48_18633 [Cryoendolithus antarcticus]